MLEQVWYKHLACIVILTITDPSMIVASISGLSRMGSALDVKQPMGSDFEHALSSPISDRAGGIA